MVMASCVAVLFGDKIRSQSKPFLYLFQLVAAKDPVHEFDIGMDRKTARAEIQQVLGLSRWVREAELFALVRNLFKDQLIQREASPDWLGRMRLDIYLPDLKLAIEHQGEQHYHPVAVFGGEEAFVRVVERDALKRQLCQANGVEVVDVRFDAPLTKPALRQRLHRYLRD